MNSRKIAMSGATAPDLTTAGTGRAPLSPAEDGLAGAAPGRLAAGRDERQVTAGGWWRAWRARFGLAEVCGTIGAVAGFTAGYLPGGSLLTAAGLATLCEVIGFYGCIGVQAALTAYRATAHLAGWHRPGRASGS